MMNFKMLVGDVDWKNYGGTFISKNVGTKGEGAEYYAIEVNNMEEDMNDDEREDAGIGRYWVRVYLVYPNNPSFAEHVEGGMKACGYDQADPKDAVLDYLKTDLGKVEMILVYGVQPVWERNGNNIKQLMHVAHEVAS